MHTIRSMVRPLHNSVTVGQQVMTPTHHPDPGPAADLPFAPAPEKLDVLHALCVEPDYSLPQKNGVTQGRLRATGSPSGTGTIVDVRDWVKDNDDRLHALVGDEMLSMPACGQQPQCFGVGAEETCVCPLEHHYDEVLAYCLPGDVEPQAEQLPIPPQADQLPLPGPQADQLPLPGPQADQLPIAPETPECCFRMGLQPEDQVITCPTLPGYDGQSVQIVSTFTYAEDHPFAGQDGVRVTGGPFGNRQAIMPVCEKELTPEDCPPGTVYTDGGCVPMEDIPTPDPDCPAGYYKGPNDECVALHPDMPGPNGEIPPHKMPPKMPDECCFDINAGVLRSPGTQLDGAPVQLHSYQLAHTGAAVALFMLQGQVWCAKICGTHDACCDACAVGLPCTGCGGDCGCGGHDDKPMENPCSGCVSEEIKEQARAMGYRVNPSYDDCTPAHIVDLDTKPTCPPHKTLVDLGNGEWVCCPMDITSKGRLPTGLHPRLGGVRVPRSVVKPAGTRVAQVHRGSRTKILAADDGHILSLKPLRRATSTFYDNYGRKVYVSRVRMMNPPIATPMAMGGCKSSSDCPKGHTCIDGDCCDNSDPLGCIDTMVAKGMSRDQATQRVTNLLGAPSSQLPPSEPCPQGTWRWPDGQCRVTPPPAGPPRPDRFAAAPQRQPVSSPSISATPASRVPQQPSSAPASRQVTTTAVSSTGATVTNPLGYFQAAAPQRGPGTPPTKSCPPGYTPTGPGGGCVDSQGNPPLPIGWRRPSSARGMDQGRPQRLAAAPTLQQMASFNLSGGDSQRAGDVCVQQGIWRCCIGSNGLWQCSNGGNRCERDPNHRFAIICDELITWIPGLDPEPDPAPLPRPGALSIPAARPVPGQLPTTPVAPARQTQVRSLVAGMVR